MYLRRVVASHYRCFERFELDLEPRGLTLITGRNNVGKSAVLRALDEAFGRGTNVDAHADRPAWAVEATLQLQPGDTSALLSGTSQHPLTSDSCIELVVVAQGGRNGRSEQLVISTPMKQRKKVREFALPGVKPELIRERISQLLDGFKSRFFHFDPVRSSRGSSSELIGAQTLDPSGANLPQALLHLISKKDRVARRTQELLNAIVPDAGELTAPAVDKTVSVAFEDPASGRTTAIQDLGTGVEQVIMTAVACFRHEQGGLLLLEEPEAHLHAGAQRQLAEQLNTWAESHQILVATHSPIFVDARQPDRSRVLLVEKQGSKSTVRLADSDLPEVLRELGVRLSDVLSAEHVIVVEGPSDEAVLREWFGDLLLKRRVTIVPAAGGDLSFQADKLGDWLKDLTKLDRRFLFIRDRDELADRNIKRLQDKGVHVLARRELENYLCEPAALKSYLDLDLTEDVIEKRLRKIADGLRPRVVMKRLVARLRDKQWMERRDADDLIKKNADAPAVAEFYRERLEALTEHVDRTEEFMKEIEADVAARWDAEWSALAPGEELLRTFIHTHRPGSGYSKTSDAARLAAHLAEPPAELRVLLEERLAEHAEA